MGDVADSSKKTTRFQFKLEGETESHFGFLVNAVFDDGNANLCTSHGVSPDAD